MLDTYDYFAKLKEIVVYNVVQSRIELLRLDIIIQVVMLLVHVETCQYKADIGNCVV